MIDLLIWLIVIPSTLYAIKFWWRAAKWFIRNKRTLGDRVQRARSVFAAGVGGDEE